MPEEPAHLVGVPKVCPRCQCRTLKFLFYNNRSVHQPRYKCLGCFKDFTLGGRIREPANLQQAQQQQQQPIGRIGVHGTTVGGAQGEVPGPSDRTLIDGEKVCGIDRNAAGGGVVGSSHNTMASEQQLVRDDSAEAAIPGNGERGDWVQVEVREVFGAVAKPVAIPRIPRYGDEVIVEGASNIWVKAVLGSAPYDLARVRDPNLKNTTTSSMELGRGSDLR